MYADVLKVLITRTFARKVEDGNTHWGIIRMSNNFARWEFRSIGDLARLEFGSVGALASWC